MKHAEDDLIRNDIPVVCYEIDGESELPFIDNGKSYGYKFANIDLDYTGKAYMGFCYGQPRMSFGDLKKDLMKNAVVELEKVRKIVTTPKFFKENDKFYQEYERLSEIAHKYRHMRDGNPDVIKLRRFIDEHGGLQFETRLYDIKYNSMFFVHYVEAVNEDKIVCRASLLEKESNATLERRIEVANSLIDNKENPINLEKGELSTDIEFIKENYHSAITTITKLLEDHKEVYLLYPQSGNSDRYVVPFLPQTIEVNLTSFTIEDYLYALPNTLYRFKKTN